MNRFIGGLLLCVVLLGLESANSQVAADQEFSHQFILDFPSLHKQEIFDRIRTWIENNLRSRKALIEDENPDAGLIVGNGMMGMKAEGDSVAVSLAFTMNVDVREGKIRIRFMHLETFRGPDEGWDRMPDEIAWHRGAQKQFEGVVKALSEYVTR